MISVTRRFLAVASACGLAASTLFYAESYFGTTMGVIGRWAFVLHIGVFIVLLPMFISAGDGKRFFSSGFAQGKPKWVVPGMQLLGLFFAFHFVLFLVQSHAATPDIQNGEYVLNNHGRIVKVLTQAEYYRLKGRRAKTVRGRVDVLLLRSDNVLVVPQESSTGRMIPARVDFKFTHNQQSLPRGGFSICAEQKLPLP